METFHAAVQAVRDNPPRGQEQLLLLYALYKQATVGDAPASRPGAFRFKERAKHDAWARRAGMPADQARAAYVTCVDKLLPGWR